MKTIEIEDDLYKYILNNIEAFGETPSQILRRLLALSEDKSTIKEIPSTKNEVALLTTSTAVSVSSSTNDEQIVITEQSEPLHKSVNELFDDPAFSREPVITNKFMTMLTTMYFEKQAEFIEAADKTKGRTRAYLGIDLDALLNSDNEEELIQFKASKPRAIPQTPFWVITNANTGRKRIILTQMMASMGYPHNLISRIKEEI